jgi:large subunit ribosomal protein L18
MRTTKPELRLKRKRRIRSKVSGTAARPRLSVYCSLQKITVQAIDDVNSTTVAFASSEMGKKNIEAAKLVGAEIGKKVKAAKIDTVVFDRNGRKYHGRLQALADAAREAGLQF